MSLRLISAFFIIFIFLIGDSLANGKDGDGTHYLTRAVLKQKLDAKNYEDIMKYLCIYNKKNLFSENVQTCLPALESGTFPFEDEDKLIKKIGGGAYGDVYHMFMKKDKDDFAIKKVEITATDTYLLESTLEDLNLGLKAEVHRQKGHEYNILRYTYCCIDFKAGLVGNTYNIHYQMPYFPDGDLRSFFKKEEKLAYRMDIRWKYNIMLGVSDGLALLHSADYMHRDLKPENVLIKDLDFPKIADYGFVRSTIIGRTDVGTPIYSAPEITSGHYTNKIDIYALGQILFEILNSGFQYTTDFKNIMRDWCLIHQKKKMNFQFNFPDFSIEHYEREVYCNYFEPLIKPMLDIDPNQRPTANDVFSYLQSSIDTVVNYYTEMNAYLIQNRSSLRQKRVLVNQEIYQQRLLFYINKVALAPTYTKDVNRNDYGFYKETHNLII